MKPIILFTFISLHLPVMAQFNTIGRINSRLQDRKEQPSPAAVKADTVHAVTTEPLLTHPPLKGVLRVTSPFGKRRNPFDKRTSEFHSGLDLAASSGSPVYAMLHGLVTDLGYDARAGNYIKVQHGPFTVCYCHLLTLPLLRIGTPVHPGQLVGQVGSTGRSTAPHLHITLKANGQTIDPAILLRHLRIL